MGRARPDSSHSARPTPTAKASRWFGSQVSNAPRVSTAPGTVKSNVSVPTTTAARHTTAAATHPTSPIATHRARCAGAVTPRRPAPRRMAANHAGTKA